MKNFTLFVTLGLLFSFVSASTVGLQCETAETICGDFTFEARVGGDAGEGNDFGCLNSQRGPAWYLLEVDEAGSIILDISAPEDIDYAAYGPFASKIEATSSCGSLSAPMSCSYSSSSTEKLTIEDATVGTFYLLLITNYAGETQNVVTNRHSESTASLKCPPPKKCYYAECGCPPFELEWCNESTFNEGWCSETAGNCDGCGGVWAGTCGGETLRPTTSTPTMFPTVTPPPPCLATGDECTATCQNNFPELDITPEFDETSEICRCLTRMTIEEMQNWIGHTQVDTSSLEAMPVNIDIQILLDVTGSMGRAVTSMSQSMIAMLDNIGTGVKTETGLDSVLRAGVVGYRDPFAGDPNEFIPFTLDNAAVDAFLHATRASGGGDLPEDVNGGLRIMLDQDWTSEHKFIVHITDVGMHGENGPDPAGVMYQDLFAEINEKAIGYIIGIMNSRRTTNMINNFNSVYAVNAEGVTVIDPSEANIDVLDLEGLNVEQLSNMFTTELVEIILQRIRAKQVNVEVGKYPLCAGPENMVELFEGEYRGEGTYWHDPSLGACGTEDSELSESLLRVGLSSYDFFDGLACGMCVEITSMTPTCEDEGCDVIETPAYAVVTNLCDECRTQDIMILDLEGRDGRNPTSWRPVPCPGVASQNIRYKIDQGSNEWFLKIQARNMLRPVASISLVGKTGDWVELRNTWESGTSGYFDTSVEDVDSVLNRPFQFPLSIRVCDIYDHCIVDTISELLKDVVIEGSSQFENVRRLLAQNN